MIVLLYLCYAVRISSKESESMSQMLKELRILMEKTKRALPEYYGRNSEENSALWKNYKTCLEKRSRLSAVYRRLPVESLTVLEGGTGTMDCNICFSPGHLEELPPKWTWSGEPMPEDDWIVVDRRTGRLQLFGARQEQNGLYVCGLGADRSAPILLTVVSASQGLRLVRGPNAQHGTEAAQEKEILIGTTKLILYSDWTPWSECSRCGEVGRHYRFGACALKLFEDNKTSVSRKRFGRKFRSRREPSKNYAFEVKDVAENYKRKLGKLVIRSESVTAKPTTPAYRSEVRILRETMETTHLSGNMSAQVLELLELFIDGLPCSSPLLPSELRNNINVLKRKNEIMEGYCKPSCVDEMFEVKDSYGKIVERVNNSGGLFSALQGPPQLPPMPSRRSIFVPIGERLTFSCPGHLHHDVPFYWTVNKSSRLYPRVIADQSRGRVTIDYRQRLIFKEVEPTDSMLYVCWQVGSIAGVVRLVAFDPATVGYNHHIMLFGATVILGVFLYLFARIYCNRLKAAAA